MVGHGANCENICTQTETIHRIDKAVTRIETSLERLPDSIALAISRHVESCRDEREKDRAAMRKSGGTDPSIKIPRAAWSRIWAAVAGLVSAAAAWAGLRLLG